jgi:hypothetical protein
MAISVDIVERQHSAPNTTGALPYPIQHPQVFSSRQDSLTQASGTRWWSRNSLKLGGSGGGGGGHGPSRGGGETSEEVITRRRRGGL